MVQRVGHLAACAGLLLSFSLRGTIAIRIGRREILSAPRQENRTVRRHWAIENELHWQLDILMAEDQTRNRRNNRRANLAALRRLALNVLRIDPETIPVSHKRLKARWASWASWASKDLLKRMTHVR